MSRGFHEYDSNAAPQAVYMKDLPSSNPSGGPAYYELDSTAAPHVQYGNSPETLPYPKRELLSHVKSSGDLHSHLSEADGLPSPWRASPRSRERPSRRLLWIIAGVMLLIFAVVAAVVGGLLGSHKSSKSNPATSGYPASGTRTPTTSVSSTSTSPIATATSSSPTAAYNGTSLSTVYYQVDGTPTTGNYVLFYQHSNGNIEKLVYNQSTWFPSALVTQDAILGTGLSSVWLGGSPISIHLYYIDKNGYLQELRGSDGSNEWVNGTLGQAGFQAAMPSPHSHLDSIFIGTCKNSVSGWVNYEAQNGVLSQAIWNQDDDSWTSGTTFPDVRPGSDFVTELEDGPDGPWRLFTSTAKEPIQEYICTDCCQNPSSNTYEPGLSFSAAIASYSGFGGANVGLPRLLYYQTPKNAIQELNSTGDGVYGNETFTISTNTVTQAMAGSRFAFVAGFQGETQQPHLFYQSNSTNIEVTSRLVTDTYWTPGVALPIGI